MRMAFLFQENWVNSITRRNEERLTLVAARIVGYYGERFRKSDFQFAGRFPA